MEPLFVNHYTISREDFKEFQWKVGKYPLMTALMSISFVLIALSLLLSGWKENLPYLILIVLIAGLVAVSYVVNSRRLWARVVEQSNGKPVEVTVTFTEENAVNESIGSEGRIVLEYASVKKALVTKHLIILMTKAKLGHILRRDSFTVGTEKEFMAFISAKIALNSLK